MARKTDRAQKAVLDLIVEVARVQASTSNANDKATVQAHKARSILMLSEAVRVARIPGGGTRHGRNVLEVGSVGVRTVREGKSRASSCHDWPFRWFRATARTESVRVGWPSVAAIWRLAQRAARRWS